MPCVTRISPCPEYAFALESHGFTAEADFGRLNGRIAVNQELMRRCFENLYANLLKYADASRPVRIRCSRQDGQALLTLANAVSKSLLYASLRVYCGIL